MVAVRWLAHVAAWPLRHIRTKIILPYAILTAVVALIGAYLITQLVAGSLQERFDNQLAEAGRVASDAVVRAEREQLKVVRAMAFTEAVPEAVEAADGERLSALLTPLFVNEGIDRVEVVGADGRRLIGLAVDERLDDGYGTIDGGDPGEWWIVQQVLSGGDEIGDKYASLVETDAGFVFYTASPVKLGGKTVGAVLAGTYVNSLVGLIKAEALADITIYDYAGTPLATTFVQPVDPSEADLVLSPDFVAAAATSSTLRESRTLFKRDYDLAYGQLEIRQEIVGLYSVALPTKFITAAGFATRLQISTVFGAVMAAVLLVGYILAQRITAPIQRLVQAARSVASGDLEARSAVSSNDEIGILARSFDQMAESLQEYTRRLRRQHISTVKALTSAIDARDPYTLGHSVRVGQLAMMLGRHVRLDEKVLGELEIGGYLHDIGKIGVRDAVLLKPGALSEHERELIEKHPIVGTNILEPVELSDEAREFVRSHHEKLDGSGYPDGRRAENLGIVARIAAVSDMYDALTSDRPYRKGMTVQETMEILWSEAGPLLDPRIVGALEAILPEWERRRKTDPTLRGFELPEAVGRATNGVAA